MWFRIDNRLIHGQVIEGWMPFTGARNLVVASDELADDFMRQQIMSLALPGNVEAFFIPVPELPKALASIDDNTFVLFESCADARRAVDAGITLPVLNIGNIHYAAGKKQILPHVALSDQDIADLYFLINVHHTKLDYRAIPTQAVKVPADIIPELQDPTL